MRRSRQNNPIDIRLGWMWSCPMCGASNRAPINVYENMEAIDLPPSFRCGQCGVIGNIEWDMSNAPKFYRPPPRGNGTHLTAPELIIKATGSSHYTQEHITKRLARLREMEETKETRRETEYLESLLERTS